MSPFSSANFFPSSGVIALLCSRSPFHYRIVQKKRRVQQQINRREKISINSRIYKYILCVFEIRTFVANQHNNHLFVRMFLNLREPTLQMIERFSPVSITNNPKKAKERIRKWGIVGWGIDQFFEWLMTKREVESPGNIVNEKSPMSSSVIRSCDGAKGLLSSLIRIENKKEEEVLGDESLPCP